MLVPMGDITKSVAYQEILAEGKLKGKIKGRIKGEIKGRMKGEIKGRREGKKQGKIEGKIKLLEKLMADGLINRTYYQQTIEPLRQKLRELKKG